MDFKDDEIKRLQLAAESEEKKRFLRNVGSLENVPEEAPKEEEAPKAEVADPSASPLKQIRTYQGDVASALEQQNESLVSIQKREALKQEEVQKNEPRSEISWKPILMWIFIILFIGVGAGGGYFAYTKYKKQTATPVVIIPANRLIPVRETKNIDTSGMTRDQFIAIVHDESGQTASPDQNAGVLQLNLRKGTGESAPLISSSEFLVMLETRAPSALVRALDPLFMFGINQNTDKEPFILFKLKSYEQAFPGMLEWEENLREDLLPLFVSTENLQNVSSESKFQDITIANKDARVLKDNSGKTVLLYTFIDNQVLLITGDETELKTLQTLYLSGKLAR